MVLVVSVLSLCDRLILLSVFHSSARHWGMAVNLKMLFLHLPKLYLGRLMWSFKSRLWKQCSQSGLVSSLFLSECNSTALSNDPLLPDRCFTDRRREEKKKNLQNMVVVVLFVTPTPACVASLLISNTKAKRSSFQSCHLDWGSLCLAEGRGFGVVNGGSNTPSYEWGLSRSQTVCRCSLSVKPSSIYCTTPLMFMGEALKLVWEQQEDQ